MKKINKQLLYESIMKSVSKIVKESLDYDDDVYDDYDFEELPDEFYDDLADEEEYYKEYALGDPDNLAQELEDMRYYSNFDPYYNI